MSRKGSGVTQSLLCFLVGIQLTLELPQIITISLTTVTYLVCIIYLSTCDDVI